MEGNKYIKFVVGLCFYLIFGYQMHHAIKTLQDKPTTMSKKNIQFYDLENKPMITICRKDQYNSLVAMNHKYLSNLEFISGLATDFYSGNMFVSWGAHLNLTFKELAYEVYGGDIKPDITVKDMVEDFTLEEMELFLANQGFCVKYTGYNSTTISVELEASSFANDSEYCVYITDPLMEIQYNIAETYTTNKEHCFGSDSIGHMLSITGLIRQSEDIKDCEEYRNVTRAHCIAKVAYDQQSPNIGGCLPPWMARNDSRACNSVNFDESALNHQVKFWFTDAFDVVIGTQLYENLCPRSCKNLDIKTVESKKVLDGRALNTTSVYINFEEVVEVRSQVGNFIYVVSGPGNTFCNGKVIKLEN